MTNTAVNAPWHANERRNI